VKGERYCTYCRRHKPDEGFKFIRHTSGTPRWMCLACQERRRLPREVLEQMAQQEKQERKRKQ